LGKLESSTSAGRTTGGVAGPAVGPAGAAGWAAAAGGADGVCGATVACVFAAPSPSTERAASRETAASAAAGLASSGGWVMERQQLELSRSGGANAHACRRLMTRHCGSSPAAGQAYNENDYQEAAGPFQPPPQPAALRSSAELSLL